MMSPIGKKINKAFTLIEILLVIVVLGIVFAAAVPTFMNSHDRLSVRQSAQELIDSARWAQAMAMAEHAVYAMKFADNGKEYSMLRAPNGLDASNPWQSVEGTRGKKRRIPEGVRLTSPDQFLRFYPDATIDPLEIRLESSRLNITLSSRIQRGTLVIVDEQAQ